jgi:hypothetical protein
MDLCPLMSDKWIKMCNSRDLRQETVKSCLLRFYREEDAGLNEASQAAFLTSILDGIIGAGNFFINAGDMQLDDLRDAVLQWKTAGRYNPALEKWLAPLDPTVPAIIGVTKADASLADVTALILDASNANKESLLTSLLSNAEFYIASVAFPPEILPSNGKAGMMIINETAETKSDQSAIRVILPFYFKVETI